MSGETDDDSQRRYNAMIQKINANNNACTEVSSSGINASRLGHFISTKTINNETLSTHQFYRGSNPTCRPAELGAAGPSITATSTASTYAQSETSSVFKMPITVQKQLQWSRIETAVELFTDAFRSSDIDKVFVKLWVRASNELVSMGRKHSTNDEIALIDSLSERLKKKYYDGRVRRPLSTTTLQNENTQFDPSGSTTSLSSGLSDSRQIASDRLPILAGSTTSLSSGPSDSRQFASYRLPILERHVNPYVTMDRRFAVYQAQKSDTHENPPVMLDQASATYQSQILSGARQANASSMVMDRTTTAYQPQIFERNDNPPPMFLDRTSSKPQPTGNRTLQTTLAKANQCALDTTQNVSMAGSKGVTRSGRVVRSPHQFWKGNQTLQAKNSLNQQGLDITGNVSMTGGKVTKLGRPVKNVDLSWKGFERKFNEPSIIHYSRSKTSQDASPAEDLNETLTLRNNKMVVRNTPIPKKPKKSTKSTPLLSIDEHETEPKKKKKPEPRKPAKSKLTQKENKENTLAKNKKSVQKAAPRATQESRKVQPKAVKKPPRKRKSKETDLTLPKRKKIEETLSDTCSSTSEYDELFGSFFKRRPQTKNQALSPSNGLHSVKKAAATSTGKETPPAKFISQLIEQDFAPTSAAKEAPESKVSRVVKRVTKMVEKKGPKKVAKKAAAKTKNNKEDPGLQKIIDDVVKSTFTSTPAGDKLSVFRATEADSDQYSEDEDSDLF